jgi:hypothetical protein
LSPRCAQTGCPTREELDDLGLARSSLELDHLRAAFLHEPHGVLQRLLARRVRHERHVGHLERPEQSFGDRLGVIDDVIERDRHGRVVPLDHHAERVADQHDVDAGLVGQRGIARVIARDARDLLAARLHPGQRRHVDGRA